VDNTGKADGPSSRGAVNNSLSPKRRIEVINGGATGPKMSKEASPSLGSCALACHTANAKQAYP
jgi:hypothetical protein